MVYIKLSDTFVEIPNTLQYPFETNEVYTLKMYNKATKIAKVSYVQGDDIEVNQYFIRIPLPQNHSTLFDGQNEYTYFFVNNSGMVIEFGLLQYGEYTPESKHTYNKATTIKEYNG